MKSISIKLNMPVSLCMALGTNGHSHDGSSPLSYILDRFVSSTGTVASVSVGDEGNKQLHASGRVGNQEGEQSNVSTVAGNRELGQSYVATVATGGYALYDNVEIKVDERQQGLIINIWGAMVKEPLR